LMAARAGGGGRVVVGSRVGERGLVERRGRWAKQFR